MNERWKLIKDFPLYEVSDMGQVRSSQMGYLHPLKPGLRNGYLFVSLYDKGRHFVESVHILVLEAFVEFRPKGYVSNHKDGNKRNNRLTNLSWVTQSENVSHAYRIGLSKAPGWHSGPGEKNPHHKLKDAEVWLIKKLLWHGHLHKEIAEMFKVSRPTITYINTGETWSHIKFDPTEKDRELYKDKQLLN